MTKNDNMNSSLINTIITSEWEIVNLYSGILTTLGNSKRNEEISSTLKEILDEKYIHLGQLQKILKTVQPAAENLDVKKES